MNKKYILFGAGKYGKAAVKYYGKENIAYFVDNNQSKWNMRIFDIPVISVEQLSKLAELSMYQILICSRYYREMSEQLQSVGIIDFEIFSPVDKRQYYPTRELILNPYDDYNEEVSEEKWNHETKHSPLLQEIRKEVIELCDNQPLFNHIEIETINRCNGVCSFCPVNSFIDPREKKIMSEKLFKEIISQLKELGYTGRLSLFSNNEALLDERVIDFYQYARKELPNAWLHLFTNGTLLTLEKFKQLIPYLDELIIDNYNQELKPIPNSRIIAEYCECHSELKSKVTIVLRKPNEILSTRGGDAPNREKIVSYGDASCVLPFKQMIIRPDGKISLCCNDPLGKNTLGDASKEKLVDIWYNDKFKMVRQCLFVGRREWAHCKYCDVLNLG